MKGRTRRRSPGSRQISEEKLHEQALDALAAAR